MDKDDLKEIIIYIVLVVLILCLLWGIGKIFADSVSDAKVITPKPGVECVVVSRMFNTSVDCWVVD